MDKVINLSTLEALDVPELITFDVTKLVNEAKLLLTARNSSSDSVVEVGAALELLLKEVAVTHDTIHLNNVDIYGVSPVDLMNKFELDIGKPMKTAFPFLIFSDLNLVSLEGNTATYTLITVEIDESNYKYI